MFGREEAPSICVVARVYPLQKLSKKVRVRPYLPGPFQCGRCVCVCVCVVGVGVYERVCVVGVCVYVYVCVASVCRQQREM